MGFFEGGFETRGGEWANFERSLLKIVGESQEEGFKGRGGEGEDVRLRLREEKSI